MIARSQFFCVMGGQVPGDRSAPVVTHDAHRAASQRVDQLDDVARERREIVTRARPVAFSVAAQVGCHGAIRSGHQRRNLQIPGTMRFGKAMQQDHGLAAPGADVVELDPAVQKVVGPFHGGHGSLRRDY